MIIKGAYAQRIAELEREIARLRVEEQERICAEFWARRAAKGAK